MNVSAESSAAGLFRNPVFLSAVGSLFMAQFLKAAIGILRNRTRSLKDVFITLFWKTGGMPSSHSALVAAMTTAIGFTEGLNTSVFILSLVFTLVVIRDALGVRRSAGQQARVLNLLGRELYSRYDLPLRLVREVHGHNPAEVLVGGVLGFFIALALCTL